MRNKEEEERWDEDRMRGETNMLVQTGVSTFKGRLKRDRFRADLGSSK